MDELRFNKREIGDYLLGSLPEAEAERFDELSLTDDDFAAALNSCEKDLVDAYVRGELTGAALEKFKTYYLASPARREKVKFAGVFQDFARRNVAQKIEISSVEKPKAKKPLADFLPALKMFAAPRAVLGWSVAAAVLLAILGGLWLALNNSIQPENRLASQPKNAPAPVNDETPKPSEKELSENSNRAPEVASANRQNETPPQNSKTETANKQSVVALPQQRTPKTSPPPTIQPIIASVLLAPSLRGANEITNLSISRKTTDIAARLRLEADDFAAYTVALTDESGAVNLWRSGKIKAVGAGENKSLNVRFPAALLKSKIYTLAVTGVSREGKTEIISNYPFRVVIK